MKRRRCARPCGQQGRGPCFCSRPAGAFRTPRGAPLNLVSHLHNERWVERVALGAVVPARIAHHACLPELLVHPVVHVPVHPQRRLVPRNHSIEVGGEPGVQPAVCEPGPDAPGAQIELCVDVPALGGAQPVRRPARASPAASSRAPVRAPASASNYRHCSAPLIVESQGLDGSVESCGFPRCRCLGTCSKRKKTRGSCQRAPGSFFPPRRCIPGARRGACAVSVVAGGGVMRGRSSSCSSYRDMLGQVPPWVREARRAGASCIERRPCALRGHRRCAHARAALSSARGPCPAALRAVDLRLHRSGPAPTLAVPRSPVRSRLRDVPFQ